MKLDNILPLGSVIEFTDKKSTFVDRISSVIIYDDSRVGYLTELYPESPTQEEHEISSDRIVRVIEEGKEVIDFSKMPKFRLTTGDKVKIKGESWDEKEDIYGIITEQYIGLGSGGEFYYRAILRGGSNGYCLCDDEWDDYDLEVL